MQEIGGYIELDSYRLPMLHEGAVALNCGRNALAYLLKARQIEHLWIPNYICDSVTGVCEREGVPYTLYGVGLDFCPTDEIRLGERDWFYFVNYFSQFDNAQIESLHRRCPRMIVDNAQSYFQPPADGVDTIYTCRKYFGVPDGSFLYTDARTGGELPQDESFARMRFLLGRYERSASEFYGEYAANNELFRDEPVKRMSKLTANLLHGIDYERVEAVRKSNYQRLHEALAPINRLPLSGKAGTFMYPLLLDGGCEIRKRLQQRKIYIPTLWPDVFAWCNDTDAAFRLAKDLLPLPIDQRYGAEEMNYIVGEIEKCMSI